MVCSREVDPEVSCYAGNGDRTPASRLGWQSFEEGDRFIEMRKGQDKLFLTASCLLLAFIYRSVVIADRGDQFSHFRRLYAFDSFNKLEGTNAHMYLSRRS